MKVRKETHHGFEIVAFTDQTGQPCTLQQSSAAMREYDDAFDRPGTSAVWLGVDEHRMHLNRKQVQTLVTLLNLWCASGSFGPGIKKA